MNKFLNVLHYQLYNQDILWQMSANERATILYLVDNISYLSTNNLAVEIGSYKGGFTKVLNNAFKKVLSVDIDHNNIVHKDSQFFYSNVEWITGNSKVILPEIMKYQSIDFLLIDGDHTKEGVRNDLYNALSISNHGKPMVILCHDAAYPDTRKGIEEALKAAPYHEKNIIPMAWDMATNGAIGQPYQLLVDLDFVPGIPFVEKKISGPDVNTTIGGLALIYRTSDFIDHD